jgi:predicted DNA binding protein
MGLKHVRLSIEVPPTSWVQELREIDGVRIRIVDCVLHEDGSIMHLISVETPDKKTAENVKNILRASKFVDEAFFAEGTAASVIGLVKTKRCTICGVFANRCFIRKGMYDISRGRIVWRLVAHEREIPHVIDGLQAQGTAFELLESVEAKALEPNKSATQLLVTALEEGYFDVPRRVTTRELAHRLGKTPATLSITLRRNIRKILKNYVTVNSF